MEFADQVDTGITAEAKSKANEFEWYGEVLEDELDVYERAVGTVYNFTPSEFTEFAFYLPSKGRYRRFSFEGRNYLRQVYDTSSNRRIVIGARQIEKCVRVSSLVSMADGRLRQLQHICSGDQVASMNTETGAEMTTGEVSWVSRRKKRRCVRILTRQGHFLEPAVTHPMRLWDRWVEAGKLEVGDRVAVVRRCGEFTGKEKCDDARLRITANLIAEGYLHGGITFSSSPSPLLAEFLEDLESLGCTWKPESKAGTDCPDIRLHVGVVHDWMEEEGLLHKKSAEKFVPDWIFGLDRRQTSMFLNRLWAGDGSIKQPTSSQHELVYCSISERLVTQVQALLWKFGIPSKIREFVPPLYEGVLNEDGSQKVAYAVRVETQEGVRRFLTEIGALGKDAALPDADENNNRDTYPIEVTGLIQQILASKGGNRRCSWRSRFHQTGLRRTLGYPPTKHKIQAYLDFFMSEGGFDENLVGELLLHLETDLYWDEVTSIEDIGEHDCIDLAVEDYHNFVPNGFVTHNSTTLGNQILSYSCLAPGFRSLYVSPSNTQTKTFSRDRIQEPLETSQFLKNFTNSRLTSNIFEKKFVNRSQVTLRFAFLNADRVRGVPADYILIDEFQDIILDNVPVIEECASHSEYKFFTYSGTPKSLDNAIEHYHSRFSTQNEWVVPCRKHGTPKDRSSWHWNILKENNIGKDGLICDKKDCGGLIFADDVDAMWAALNPNPRVEQPYEGYRIPQLMVPWLNWGELLDKYEKYSRNKFYNEVLGRSYDSGTRPLTQKDIMPNCNESLSMRHYKRVKEKWAGTVPVFLGVDWGSSERDSHTVITLGAYLPFDPDYYTIFFAKRLTGAEAEPRSQMELVKKLGHEFNVAHIGADYGQGHYQNDELLREFGAARVHKYQYVGNVKKKIAFDPKMGVPRFLCHRTEVMSDIFNAIKRGNVFRFPRWKEFYDPFALDMLNVFSEYNERRRVNEYKRGPGYPDDTLHSLVFGFLASFFYKKRPDVILPTLEVKHGGKNHPGGDLKSDEEYGGEDELDITSGGPPKR